MQALDLAGAEERLVDRVALARDDDGRRLVLQLGAQDTRQAPWLGRHEQPLARVEGLLGAPPAGSELARRGAVRGDELAAQKPRHRAAKPVDRLVGVTDDDQSRSRLRRGDQAEELELRWVDVLELVDKHQRELRPQSLPHSRVGLQELDRPRDQVAEVDQLRALHPLLVRAVDRRQHA